MTYKEIVEKKGWSIEDFRKICGGWYNIDFILEKYWDKKVYDRYILWCDKPFYQLNQRYNEEYEKDSDIGSTYDWLEDCPTEDEIEECLKSLDIEK